MTEEEWEETLIDWPEQSPLYWRDVGSTRPRHRFIRYRPATRQQCNLCVEEIYRRGPEVAGPLGVVRWKVVTGTVTQTMCERHKCEIEEYP